MEQGAPSLDVKKTGDGGLVQIRKSRIDFQVLILRRYRAPNLIAP